MFRFAISTKPQGGIPQQKDTFLWQHGCDETLAEADRRLVLKSSILFGRTLDKFFLPIAEPYIRHYLILIDIDSANFSNEY